MRTRIGKLARLAVAISIGIATVLPGAAQNRHRPAILAISHAAPRAIVVVDGISHGRVDQSGALEIDTIGPGRYTVLVRQLGFEDYSQPVTLVAGRTVTVRPKRAPIEDTNEFAFHRGEDFYADGKNEEAVEAFQQAIGGRGGTYPEAQIGLARALLALKRTDPATAAVAAVVADNPKSVEGHTVLANVLRERGLYDEAASEYRKAIELAPDRSPEAHTGLAMLLEEQGEHERAIAEFRTAIAQNQDAEPLLYQLLGSALEHTERRDEAVTAYERYLVLAPKSSLAPAVRSIVERLKASDDEEDEGDVNPYAPPRQ